MITVAAWQQSIAIILVIVYSDGYQNNMVFEKIEPVAETGLTTVKDLKGSNFLLDTLNAKSNSRP